MCISISNVKRYGMDYLPDSYFVFVFFRLSFLYGGVRLKKGKWSWKVYKEIIMDYKQYIKRENNYLFNLCLVVHMSS